jgi:hypothetical protein
MQKHLSGGAGKPNNSNSGGCSRGSGSGGGGSGGGSGMADYGDLGAALIREAEIFDDERVSQIFFF